MAYEEHVSKGCEIERYLAGAEAEAKGVDRSSESRGSPKATTQADTSPAAAAKAPPPPPKAGASKSSAMAAPAARASDIAPISSSGTVHVDATSVVAQANIGTPQKAVAQDTAAQAQADVPAPIAEGQVRQARYDYNPRESDQAQIILKANDLVKIFEVTEWGWAAGVRLCKDSMTEIGDAGWFPAGYLYPPEHVITK